MYASLFKKWKSLGISFMNLGQIIQNEGYVPSDDDIKEWVTKIKETDESKGKLIVETHKFLKSLQENKEDNNGTSL